MLVHWFRYVARWCRRFTGYGSSLIRIVHLCIRPFVRKVCLNIIHFDLICNVRKCTARYAQEKFLNFIYFKILEMVHVAIRCEHSYSSSTTLWSSVVLLRAHAESPVLRGLHLWKTILKLGFHHPAALARTAGRSNTEWAGRGEGRRLAKVTG
jgi:hypothetical protein